MGDATDASGELTTAAKTWQAGLTGITPQQLGKGLERAALSGQAWNPSLPEFRALCEHRDDVPSIDQVITIIAKSVPMQGSIAKRYKHPLVLAVAKSDGFDAWLFKTATTKQCTDMVKPIYAKLLQGGWDDFLPEHYEEQKAIAKPLKQTSGFGLAALSSLKANLGLVNDLPEKTITATAEEIKREIMARDPEAQARKQKMLMEAKKKMELAANV